MQTASLNRRCLTALLALLAVDVCRFPVIGQTLTWSHLQPLPDAKGFAGPIVGLANGKLLVAGGANFPDKPPWLGGTKRWYDRVFILSEPSGNWRVAGELPQPLAYSVCITTPQGIAVVGGSNESGHVAECFVLKLYRDKLSFVSLSPLPLAISNACGAMLDSRLYVAGGTAAPNATQALDAFFSLDMNRPELGWRKEPTWPGSPRMLATAATQGDAFFLVGGVALSAEGDSLPRRTYLRDAYRFVPSAGWTKIADLPYPLAASPSPAPNYGASHFLVLGGDDGSQIDVPPQRHPGFRREVLRYDTRANQWSEFGTLPRALVTTTAVAWDSRIIVPGGEARPGVRSTEVLSGAMPEP